MFISMTIAIGLTGLAGSGKSTVAKYLKEKYEYEFLVLSDVLKAEAAVRGLLLGKSMEEQKLALSKLGDEWRKETGKEEIVAEKLIEIIKQRKLQKVVIDGFRSPAEVELFKKNFEKFYLIYISTDFEMRFNRRLMDDPAAEKGQMLERDRGDIEKKGLQNVIDTADFILDNNGTLKDLQHNIDVIVGAL